MAPLTRSAAKATPGRSTRNSIYGRPPPSPSKSSKSSTSDSAAWKVAPANDINPTPWLSCRDAYGVLTTVAMSETGEGVHIRWYYPDEDREIDEDVDADAEMMVVEELLERAVTPQVATAGPSNAVRRPFPFPHTPMALQPYDAGSVIRTPVKKAKPLQRSPLRIGDKGVRCLYEKSGVLRELNGGVRVVLRHPIGSSANLSRQQVELLEMEQEDRIARVQIEKLLAQKRRVEEELEKERFSDSGYEDEMEADGPSSSSSQCGFQREGTGDTIPDSRALTDTASTSSGLKTEPLDFFLRNGELFDQSGRQILVQEGTLLIDPAYGSPRRIRREEAFRASDSTGERKFGPEGTELID